MQRTIHPKQFVKFVLFNLVLALIVCISICANCFTSWAGFTSIADDLLFSFLISSLISGGLSMLIGFSERILPWIKAPAKRFVFDLVVITTYSYLVSLILVSVFIVYVWQFATWESLTLAKASENTILPVSIALFITFVLTSRSFLLQWRNASIEAEKIKSERLKSQYQSLKDQLNPHFLFNSLNVLSNLVYESPERSNAFIEKLARVYRYVLEVQNEELVMLDKEVEFARNYLELQQIRFGDKLSYALDIDASVEGMIPPLALQLLLENVLKHNGASHDNPLRVSIYIEDGMLVVKNNRQKRNGREAPSGIGLANIRERYRFFTDKQVEIEEKQGFFIASLPLISKLDTA